MVHLKNTTATILLSEKNVGSDFALMARICAVKPIVAHGATSVHPNEERATQDARGFVDSF
jgi:hypothetical protein